MLDINVVGGISSPIGPMLGAILLVPLPELLRDAKQYQMLTYGLLLMTAVLFLPSGVAGGCAAYDNGSAHHDGPP